MRPFNRHPMLRLTMCALTIAALGAAPAWAASKKKAKGAARGKAKVEAPVDSGAEPKSLDPASKSDAETELPISGDGHDDFGPLSEPQGAGAPAAEAQGEGRASPVGDDALRLGPFVAPPKAFPFPLLGEDRQKETFVDREGKLYKDRPYSGHIPDWNSEVQTNAAGRCRVEPQLLTWVGFQNTPDASRVYVQLEHEACGYVYRPDDTHVVIDLPQVGVMNANLRREILTGAFPTAIDFIRAEDMGNRGTRIVIALKDKRNYLSAHLGRYVFVDIAR